MPPRMSAIGLLRMTPECFVGCCLLLKAILRPCKDGYSVIYDVQNELEGLAAAR